MLEFIRSKAQGWFAWIIVGAIIATFALFGIEQYIRSGSKSNVATVNGEEISQARLQEAYQAQRQRLQQMFGENFNPEMFPEARMKEQILDELIKQELLIQAAADNGLRIGDEQLAGMIREVPQFQRDGKFSQAAYEQAVRSLGQSVAFFEERARRELLAQQLQAAVMGSEFATAGEELGLMQLRKQTRDVGFMALPASNYEKDVTVSEDEIGRYYQENASRYVVPEQIAVDYIELNAQTMATGITVSEQEIAERYESQKINYRTPDERKARHILIRVAKDADEKSVAEAKNKIEALAQRIAKGESFAEVAKANSQDPGSAQQGGDLGFFGRGVMDPAFESAVFALKKGEISQPVRSAFGFHLIQLDDIRGGDTKPLSEVHNQIAAEIRQEQAEQKFFELAGKLGNIVYEHPDTLEEASNQLGLPLQQSPVFARSGGPGIAANPKVVTAAFSDKVLKDGENSEVIEVNDKHLVVVHLREHTPEKSRALEEVKAEITAQLKKNKAKVRAEEVADTLLSRLGQGEDPQVLAKEAGVEWRRVEHVTRDGAEVPPAVVAQVFRMAHPANATSPVTAKATMPDGGQALIALYGVATPSQPDSGESDMLKRQVQQAHAEAAFNAMLASLKAKATIKQ
ncbi:MAG TPA: SurA N-terminal domain-containing protein [Gammaproteobacteria bacterium]